MKKKNQNKIENNYSICCKTRKIVYFVSVLLAMMPLESVKIILCWQLILLMHNPMQAN